MSYGRDINKEMPSMKPRRVSEYWLEKMRIRDEARQKELDKYGDFIMTGPNKTPINRKQKS